MATLEIYGQMRARLTPERPHPDGTRHFLGLIDPKTIQGRRASDLGRSSVELYIQTFKGIHEMVMLSPTLSAKWDGKCAVYGFDEFSPSPVFSGSRISPFTLFMNRDGVVFLEGGGPTSQVTISHARSDSALVDQYGRQTNDPPTRAMKLDEVGTSWRTNEKPYLPSLDKFSIPPGGNLTNRTGGFPVLE